MQILEKKEVKRWKKSLREVSGLTLCGKRIQQYCDTNKDKRLSQKEWTKCLDVAMGMILPTINIYVCIYQVTKTFLISRRLWSRDSDPLYHQTFHRTETRTKSIEDLAKWRLICEIFSSCDIFCFWQLKKEHHYYYTPSSLMYKECKKCSYLFQWLMWFHVNLWNINLKNI